MKILLDTQVFIWFVENDINLPINVKLKVESSSNSIYVSIASLWEMTIKYSLGKLKLSLSLEKMIEQITSNGFEILPILPKHLIKLSTLAIFHSDPFDRLIIAQGLNENMLIATSDDKFDYYKIYRLWK